MAQSQTSKVTILNVRLRGTSQKMSIKAYSQMKDTKPYNKNTFQNNIIQQDAALKKKQNNNIQIAKAKKTDQCNQINEYYGHSYNEALIKKGIKPHPKANHHMAGLAGIKLKVIEDRYQHCNANKTINQKIINQAAVQQKVQNELIQSKISMNQKEQSLTRQSNIFSLQSSPQKISSLQSILKSQKMNDNTGLNDLFLLKDGNHPEYLQKIMSSLDNDSQTYKVAQQLKTFFQQISKSYQSLRAVIDPSYTRQFQYLKTGLFIDFQDIIKQILIKLHTIFNLKEHNPNYYKDLSLNTIANSYKEIFLKLQKIQQKLKDSNQQKQDNQKVKKQKEHAFTQQIKNLEDILAKQQQRKRQIQNITTQLILYKQKYHELELQKKNYKKEVIILNQTKKKYQSLAAKCISKEEVSSQKENYTKEIQLKNHKIQQLIQTNRKYENKFKQSNDQIERLQGLVQKYQNQNKLIKNKFKNLQNEVKIVRCRQMLQSSDILSLKDQSQKLNLCSMIKAQANITPTQFKLLYKFNKQIQTNFHDYIDGKPNVLLLIQLQNNVIVGGYSRDPLKKNSPSLSGFIFSLTLNRAYPLKFMQQGVVAFVYDQFFIIFGNSQLRIRMGQDTLFSNFSITNSFFNSKNDKISHFLHNGQNYSNNTVKMIGYQCYQVKFD